jgi:hypothetical protein
MNMKEMNPTELIDEAELRVALQPLRPAPDSFASGIRQQIEAAERKSRYGGDEAKLDQSDWLHVAAAVIPLPLLGNGGGMGLIQFGKLSLGKKMIAIAALPAIGLLLMVTATIWATVKIRQAQRGQSVGDLDVSKVAEVTGSWWRQFGALVVGMAVVSLLLMFTGFTLPVLIIFLVSGITMVSLITKLGQEQLVDRNSIAAALCPGLLILVQITHIATMFSQGNPFLDQMLIPAVLVLGGLVIMLMCVTPIERFSRVKGYVFKTVFAIALLWMAGWFSSSIWNPVSTQDLKHHVESFDHAKFSSASWQQWQVPAQWLRDTKIPLDLSKPQALLQTELAQDMPNHVILYSAIEAGLLQSQDLAHVPDLAEARHRIFNDSARGKPFITVDSPTSFLIHAWLMRGELSESERDFLGERLTATMDSLRTKTYGSILEEQLAITKLAQSIDRPLDIESQCDFIHETLVRYQRLNKRLGTRHGGFANNDNLNFSNELATADAIELMQIYGVPAGVRIDALRSYLRPTAHDHWSRLRSQVGVRVASFQRLESLPDVRPITWLDYIRYEQSLMMAILFTLVCVFATWGAPKLSSGPASK